MRFPDSFLDEIRHRLPITDLIGQYVTWDREKSNPKIDDMWACCPFHGESTPSFHAEGAKGLYHCFGCGVSGDHFKFLTEHRGLSFPDAVATAAELAGVPMPDSGKDAGARKGDPGRNHASASETPPESSPKGKREVVEVYPYTDSDGELIYEVVRFQERLPDGSWRRTKDGNGTWKTFLQRRPSRLPDKSNVWGLSEGEHMRPEPGKDWRRFHQETFANWQKGEKRRFDGVDHTILNHPEVEIAISENRPVFLVEGEKDAKTVKGLGLTGTTNSGGAKHWSDVHAGYFRDAIVFILCDNDDAGRAGAHKRAQSLKGIARSVRIIDLAAFVPDFPAKGDVTDWVEKFGGTIDQLRDFARRSREWSPAPPESKFGAVDMKGLAGAPISYEWLVKGLIERKGVFFVAGEKQSGKSFFVMDLGMKIARGIDYCRRKVVKGMVIHMAVEDGRGVQMRAEGYRVDNKIPDDENVPFMVMGAGGEKFSLMSDEGVDRFIDECLAWESYYGIKLELIIIDTLAAAAAGMDEISGRDTSQVLGRINRIAERTRSAVCVVHHMNAKGERMRGHGNFGDNVAQVIEIRPLQKPLKYRNAVPEYVFDSNKLLIRQAVLDKNKNGPNQLRWRFVLKPVDLGMDADGDRITTCVLAEPSSEPDVGQIKTGNMSADQRLVLGALKDAVAENPIAPPPGTLVGESVKKVASNQTFVDIVRKRMTFVATDEDDRKKELQAFLKRNVTALINKGAVGRDNDAKVLWPTRPVPETVAPSETDENRLDMGSSDIPPDVAAEIREAGGLM